MDATREHLLGRICLERRIVLEDELRRLVGERDDLARRGNASVSLGQLLVRDRRLEVAQLIGLQNEIELRGRACFACKRAYLVAAGGPANCPACGGPALLPAAGGVARATAPAAAVAQPNMLASGVVRPQVPSPTSSAAIRAAPPTRSDPSSHGASGPWSPSSTPGTLPSTDPGSKGSSKGSGIPGSGGGSGPVPAANARAKDLGKTLGPYELEKELGRGGMGVVYKARDTRNGESVALKVLLSAEFASKKMVARFQDEAKLVQKLDHPNIVPVLDIGTEGETQYFTMKFIDGELFSDMIKGRGLSARRGAEILRDIAKGAHHAHESGIIHRDLKPANIIVERETGRPYLMDFGLAKDLDDDKHLSKTGVAIGTPYYMPPEQALGKHREIDPRTDVYALGAMLYEVLAKKLPFNAETQAALLRKIIEDEPVPPSQLKQGVPPDLETIALKAIRKNKDERYPGANAFAADIERALKGKEIKAEREAAWAPLVRTVKKNPKVAGGIVVAAAIATGGLAFGVYQYNKLARIQKEKEDEDARKEAERKAAEEKKAQDEAATKKKADLEDQERKGHQGRLDARSALSAEEAKRKLGKAIRDLSDALANADDGSETKARILYERGLARLELGNQGAISGALEDFEQAKAQKTLKARASLLAAIVALRKDHDSTRAQKTLDEAKTAADGASSLDDERARLEERAAGALAQGYSKFLSGDAQGAIASCREAERSDLLEYAADAQAFILLHATPPNATAALQAASRAWAQNHWSYAALCDRGQARAITGDTALAKQDSKTARDVCPEAREAFLIDAWIGAQTGNEDDMRSALSEARRDTSQARDYWEKVESRLNAALEGRKLPPPPPPDSSPPGSTHFLYEEFRFQVCEKCAPFLQEVSALQDQGKFSQVLERLAKLETEQPHEIAFRLWHAQILANEGRGPEARKDVEPVLERTPDDALALTLMGEIERQAGNNSKAVEHFEQCISKYPQFRTPRMIAAGVYRLMSKNEEAYRALSPIFEADEKDGEAGNLMILALVGQGKNQEALDLARKALTATPGSFPIRIAYMVVLRKMNRGEEAMRFAEEGEKADPRSWARVLEKAIALHFASREPECQEHLKRARELATTEADRSQVEVITIQLRNAPPGNN